MARQFADDTAAMYERAIMLLRSNIMLYFAYADYEEGRCKYAKVHSIYKKLISLEGIDPTLVRTAFYSSSMLSLSTWCTHGLDYRPLQNDRHHGRFLYSLNLLSAREKHKAGFRITVPVSKEAGQRCV